MFSCPCRQEAEYTRELYQQVESRMRTLMPGWFDRLDEMMDPYGPEPDIQCVAATVAKTGKPIDDAIHEVMYDDWFKYHDDFDESW